MPTLAAMISVLFILVLSTVAVAVGVGYVRKASAMRGFVSTQGTVIAREVVAMSGDTREPAFGQGGGYTPKVTYRFTAGGREHTSDKLGYATRGYKNEVAARRLAAIPDEVEVWFDPENPTDAYIERHTPGIGWVMIVCGALGMVGALAWLTL